MFRRARSLLTFTTAALVLTGLAGCAKEEAPAPAAVAGPPPVPTLEQIKGANRFGRLRPGRHAGERHLPWRAAVPGAASHQMLTLWEPTVPLR